jgi:hypothetical protein
MWMAAFNLDVASRPLLMLLKWRCGSAGLKMLRALAAQLISYRRASDAGEN